MRIKNSDRGIIKPYIKLIKVTENDYNKIKELKINNMPLGRVITLLIKEHESKIDYLRKKKK